MNATPEKPEGGEPFVLARRGMPLTGATRGVLSAPWLPAALRCRAQPVRVWAGPPQSEIPEQPSEEFQLGEGSVGHATVEPLVNVVPAATSGSAPAWPLSPHSRDAAAALPTARMARPLEPRVPAAQAPGLGTVQRFQPARAPLQAAVRPPVQAAATRPDAGTGTRPERTAAMPEPAADTPAVVAPSSAAVRTSAMGWLAPVGQDAAAATLPQRHPTLERLLAPPKPVAPGPSIERIEVTVQAPTPAPAVQPVPATAPATTPRHAPPSAYRNPWSSYFVRRD